MAIDDDILDDLFHACAFAAYVELATACRGVPDLEATRLAYLFFEEELAASRGLSETSSMK